MTQEQISQGNKVIAEFMGADKAIDPRDLIYHYHTSWDWLMPVVAKIESIRGTKFLIKPFACEILIFGKSMINHVSDSKIETVFLAVVDFIKLNQKPS